MAQQKASARTTLRIGGVIAPIALYKATDDKHKAHTWEKAGPNGGALTTRTVLADEADRPPEDALGVDQPAPPPAPEPEPTPTEPDPGPETTPNFETMAGAFMGSQPPQMVTQLIEDGTGEVVAPEDVRRGLRRPDGVFVDLTDHLARIDADTKLEEMEIVAFIDVGQVPRERIVGSYFVGADEPGSPKVLRLLYEAMRRRRRVAVVRWTKTSRQALGILTPHGPSKTLVALQIAWSANVRPAPEQATAIQRVTTTQQEIDVTAALVAAMSDTRLALDELVDDTAAAYGALRADALADNVEPLYEAEAKPTTEGMELIDALAAEAERAAK